MDLDTTLKIQAIEKAQQMLKEIVESCRKPTKSITGETLVAYEEFDAWGLFEQNPITDNKNHAMYVHMLAMQIYRQLKRQKDHPPEPKKSKWEVVMGRCSTGVAPKVVQKNLPPTRSSVQGPLPLADNGPQK